jgi:hypothetical protein
MGAQPLPERPGVALARPTARRGNRPAKVWTGKRRPCPDYLRAGAQADIVEQRLAFYDEVAPPPELDPQPTATGDAALGALPGAGKLYAALRRAGDPRAAVGAPLYLARALEYRARCRAASGLVLSARADVRECRRILAGVLQ